MGAVLSNLVAADAAATDGEEVCVTAGTSAGRRDFELVLESTSSRFYNDQVEWYVECSFY